LLEATKTLKLKQMGEQKIGILQLGAKQHGIIIKLRATRLHYNFQRQDYFFNLIDTLIYVDFRSEVLRSFYACEST